MKVDFKKLYGIGMGVMAIIGSIVLFPEFNNKNLHQAKINYTSLGAFVVVIAYGITLLISVFVTKKKHFVIFVSAGVISLVAFISLLFTSYSPFVNEKILEMRFSCGGIFIRGDSVNYSVLEGDRRSEYDSLSKFDPKKLVENVNCDPALAWTSQSIESNFKGIVYRYVLLVLFASLGLITMTRAPDKSLSKVQPKRNPKGPVAGNV